ncbi:hypothetical protein B0H21DRAFT_749241 [Amylocystis lapponica]|nr:hypothetical protein B0H21DRAFT_749241 [Amylocystis lapponica]
MMSDDNPRPAKRQRRSESPLSSSSDIVQPNFTPLPPAVLLVSLPSLLVHPPNHPAYVNSLCLSLTSLRRCLALGSLPPEIECRAWTGLAELGMKVISGGFSQSADYPWARGIESEVEKALSKGSIIAQKHPSLRAYKHQLALLQAQLSQWQHKTKFTRVQIRNLIASLLPTDPPYIIYSAHLASITLLTTPTSVSSTEPVHRRQDINAALSAVQDLEALATQNAHAHVKLLALVLRVRILVASGMWADVLAALLCAENVLGLSYEPASTPKVRKPLAPADHTSQTVPPGVPPQETEFIYFEDAFEAAMVVHLLIMAVVFHTHLGNAADASPRLSHLHALLDSGALDKFPSGYVEIALPSGPPLTIQATHPRILFMLAFLVSSTAKRDAVGRKPKRKVFAFEGLAMWETEVTREIMFSPWAGQGDVEEVEQRLARIKADLLCELIAVSIMRSEFDSAEENMNLLIAHTRAYALFPLFAARIALHHAHLAHALGQAPRALQCYRAAAHLAEPGSFVNIAARAGEVVLKIGLKEGELHNDKDDCRSEELDEDEDEDQKDGLLIVKACRGMGGTLEALGQVIEACLTPEILKAKQHLKLALSIATKAQDNHLRALVLALISSHYFHTASDHALEMLQTCEQLAAGLGAPPTKTVSNSQGDTTQMSVVVGNAPLGLWVGERFMELFKRAGKEARVRKQATVNAELVKAVDALAQRSLAAQHMVASS